MTTAEHRAQLGHLATARAAQRLILEQHTELRRLLAFALIETCLPLRGQPSAPTTLRFLVARIRTAFIEHLGDEEAALPLLLDGDTLPRRAQILREEHARQRRALDEVHALSQTESAAVFAERFDALARTLLIDIAEEERELTRARAACDQRARSRERAAVAPG